MNRTGKPTFTFALASTLSVASLLIATGCTASPATKEVTESSESDSPNTTTGKEKGSQESGVRVSTVSGYPLNRSLDSLVNMEGVTTIVTITDPSAEDAKYVGADYIITPVSATVGKVLRGDASPGDAVTVVIGGGQVGDHTVRAEGEIAPDLDELTNYDNVLIGGEFTEIDGIGKVLDPYFVYGLDPETGVTDSLMESAGGGDTTFKIPELRTELAEAETAEESVE